MFVVLGALVAGLLAWALTPLLLRSATTDARLLHRPWHILVAAVLGGLAGTAASGTEVLLFTLLAVASGLLAVVDLAEERLPDAIVLPMIGLTAVLLVLAAWTSGNWAALGRAGLAALGSFVLYFAMMVFSPDLGFGDVKLAVVAGAFCGWFGWGAVLLGFGAAWATFAVVGVVLLATGRRHRNGSMAFGPFLILGSVLGVMWAGAFLTW